MTRSQILSAILLGLALILLWLDLFSLPQGPVSQALDSSWCGALIHFSTLKLQFGKDVIFTYGPLAHLISALMGYGRICFGKEAVPAAAALERLGLQPLQLGPKEGLALINGTQASAALALDALFQGERVFAAAIAAGALSVDALKGSAKPFDPQSFLEGHMTPVIFGSALRHFGVAELLTTLSAYAPPPRATWEQADRSGECSGKLYG